MPHHFSEIDYLQERENLQLIKERNLPSGQPLKPHINLMPAFNNIVIAERGRFQKPRPTSAKKIILVQASN